MTATRTLGSLVPDRSVERAGQYILQVNDVSTQFDNDTTGPQYAARNVSFELRAGETLGIVGESGSGKTVTMMSVLGLARYFGERGARLALQI